MAPTPGQDPQGYPKLDIKAARALAPHIQTIHIESILGGHSLSPNFASRDQFRTSLGIDPGQPISDTISATTVGSSGYLRPAATERLSVGLSHIPRWMVPAIKPTNANIFVTDFAGSVYTMSGNLGAVTALSDGGTLTGGTGNGLAYYDNYIYIAKDTEIARYGPLDGVATFNGTYWTGTLGKAALSNFSYPYMTNLLTVGSYQYPNHPMHRHSDGKLYIADVNSAGQGVIHVISTTKTTTEGDTDSGSTYQKLLFGYGLYPTAIESYGSSLVISLIEFSTLNRGAPAKIAFWDTTSQNFNSIIWVEFPDPLITALKNVNGILYAFSGNYLINGSTGIGGGFRVSQYVGGSTFKDVLYYEDGSIPSQGAVDGAADRLICGITTVAPEISASVISIGGLQKTGMSKGTFNIMRSTTTGTSLATTAVLLWDKKGDTGNVGFSKFVPVIGSTNGSSGTSNNGIDVQGITYGNSNSVWWSQSYRIGAPFKIRRIRIPFAQAIAANMILTAKVYTDDGAGTTYTLQTINNTNYPGKSSITFRSAAGAVMTGDHNFWIELKWTGSVLCTVALPIIVEYELTDDN